MLPQPETSTAARNMTTVKPDILSATTIFDPVYATTSNQGSNALYRRDLQLGDQFLDAQKQALPGGKRLTKKNTRWCGRLAWSHRYNV
jgi:hypothetical protein